MRNHAGLIVLVQPSLHVKPPQCVGHVRIGICRFEDRHVQMCGSETLFISPAHQVSTQGRIQDLIRGGPQIVTGLKLPFWGLSFVEFWCWGLIFGGHGGDLGPWGPPGSAPEYISPDSSRLLLDSIALIAKINKGHSLYI